METVLFNIAIDNAASSIVSDQNHKFMHPPRYFQRSALLSAFNPLSNIFLSHVYFNIYCCFRDMLFKSEVSHAGAILKK